jgi:cytochrome P450 family 135
LRTLFGPPFVVVCDPELVGQVFRASPVELCAGRANAGVEPLHGAHSLMVLGGDEHLRQRRLMLPAFKGRRMCAYEAVIVAAADRAIDSWPVGKTFELLPSMYSLTLDVAIGAIFGVDLDEGSDALKQAMRRTLEAHAPRRFGQDHRTLDELIHAEIRRRRDAPDLAERADVLSSLLAARDEDGGGMSDDEVHDELVTLLIAGHETTASSLAWAFELLLRHPAKLTRLRRSLASGEDAYLDAVIKETLRLRPAAAGIGRLVVGEPFALNGYRVEAETEISPSIEAIHARPDLYPEPGEFRPERFLGEDTPGNTEWLPFGGGVRRCLGDRFAMFEMATTIRRVLERTELAPSGPPARGRVRAVTPPSRRALARSLRRGRRMVPANGVRVVQPRPPRQASASAECFSSGGVVAGGARSRGTT